MNTRTELRLYRWTQSFVCIDGSVAADATWAPLRIEFATIVVSSPFSSKEAKAADSLALEAKATNAIRTTTCTQKYSLLSVYYYRNSYCGVIETMPFLLNCHKMVSSWPVGGHSIRDKSLFRIDKHFRAKYTPQSHCLLFRANLTGRHRDRVCEYRRPSQRTQWSIIIIISRRRIC